MIDCHVKFLYNAIRRNDLPFFPPVSKQEYGERTRE